MSVAVAVAVKLVHFVLHSLYGAFMRVRVQHASGQRVLTVEPATDAIAFLRLLVTEGLLPSEDSPLLLAGLPPVSVTVAELADALRDGARFIVPSSTISDVLVSTCTALPASSASSPAPAAATSSGCAARPCSAWASSGPPWAWRPSATTP